MLCRYCGNQNDNKSTVCAFCGRALYDADATAAGAFSYPAGNNAPGYAQGADPQYANPQPGYGPPANGQYVNPYLAQPQDPQSDATVVMRGPYGQQPGYGSPANGQYVNPYPAQRQGPQSDAAAMRGPYGQPANGQYVNPYPAQPQDMQSDATVVMRGAYGQQPGYGQPVNPQPGFAQPGYPQGQTADPKKKKNGSSKMIVGIAAGVAAALVILSLLGIFVIYPRLVENNYELEDVQLYVGESYDFGVSKASLITSDGGVASIEGSSVNALSPGVVTITSKYLFSSDSCTVTVSEETVSLTKPADTTLAAGGVITIEATIDGPSDVSDLTWEVDNEKVASVDATGKLSAHSPGSVTVTASLPGGGSDTCRFTVTAPEVNQKNGFVKTPSGSKIAPVTVHASSDRSAFVYFKSLSDASKDFSLFIGKGTTVNVDVPVGKYEMYYASGAVWYGTEFKFGADTVYKTTDEVFNFYTSGNYAYGTELTLYTVSGGNLSTKEIDGSDFPD